MADTSAQQPAEAVTLQQRSSFARRVLPTARKTHAGALLAAIIIATGSTLQLMPAAHAQTQTQTQNAAAKTRAANAAEALPLLPVKMAQANLRLHENTKELRGNAAIIGAGEPVPAFALYDQDANPVLVPEQWHGKYVVINFIFTRCKVANMCPAATARMAGLQRTLESQGRSDKVQLLSISFDPRYDSPQVLKQYSTLFGAKLDNYAFLTGTETTIHDVLRRFGVLTRHEDGTINHSMVTALIDPDGNLSLRQIGPNWTAEAILEQLDAAERSPE